MQERAVRKNGTRLATRAEEIQEVTMEELRYMVEVPGGGKISDDLLKKENQVWLAEFDRRYKGASVEDVGSHPKFLPPINPSRFTFRDMLISRCAGDHNVTLPYTIIDNSSSSSSSTWSSSEDSGEAAIREQHDGITSDIQPPSFRATQRHVVRTFGGVHGEDEKEEKEDPRDVRWRRKMREAEKDEFPGGLFDGKWADEQSNEIKSSSTSTSEFEGEEVLLSDTTADPEEMYPY